MALFFLNLCKFETLRSILFLLSEKQLLCPPQLTLSLKNAQASWAAAGAEAELWKCLTRCGFVPWHPVWGLQTVTPACQCSETLLSSTVSRAQSLLQFLTAGGWGERAREAATVPARLWDMSHGGGSCDGHGLCLSALSSCGFEVLFHFLWIASLKPSWDDTLIFHLKNQTVNVWLLCTFCRTGSAAVLTQLGAFQKTSAFLRGF